MRTWGGRPQFKEDKLNVQQTIELAKTPLEGDKTITCRDCGREFVFTLQLQLFYQERGLYEPKKCKPCRMARKGNHDNTQANKS